MVKCSKHYVHVHRIFSRDILKGENIGVLAGVRGVLEVYYLLETIITANLKGGRQQSRGGRFPPPPP